MKNKREVVRLDEDRLRLLLLDVPLLVFQMLNRYLNKQDLCILIKGIHEE
jgi:hypothetical protein